MTNLRFAILGAGFWSRFQLAAWQELEGAECVAVYNRSRPKAEALAAEFGVPAVFDDPEAMLDRERLDFVDIITSPDTHARFVRLAARRGLGVICQKPMALALEDAEAMVAACRVANVPFLIHENFRWQRPIRELKRVLDEGRIGRPFRARLTFSTSFPVFENQPFLKDLDRFILGDVGVHELDVARFLFGEARSVYCLTDRISNEIRGEDVATVVARMGDTTVTCELSYASRLEREQFPETFVLVEGDRGSVELAPDFWIRVTDEKGTDARRFPPQHRPWADPAYDVVHSSIVSCNANLLLGLQGIAPAETTGDDNLETLRLVFGAYESAATGRVVQLEPTRQEMK